MKTQYLMAISACSALAACQDVGTFHQAVDRSNVQFVRLDQNVRFAGQAYAKGEVFELVRLSNGVKIAIMQRVARTDDLLVGVVGPLLSVSSSWAVVLDENYCTIGQGASVQGAGSPRDGQNVAVFEGYGPGELQPVFETPSRFCFELV